MAELNLEDIAADMAMSEDVCKICGEHLGFGLPFLHLGDCGGHSEEDVEIDRKMANSSAILSVGYSESHAILEVEYANGGIYRAYNVDAADWEPIEKSLKDTTLSTGRLVQILKQKYEFERMN